MTLQDLYAKLTKEQRLALAAKIGTEPVYLHQLATHFRRPSIDLLVALAKADRRLKIADMALEFAAVTSTKKRSPEAQGAGA